VLDPDLNGNTADAGAMWIAGETFTDATNQISVAVLSATATGFTVRIQLGPAGGPPAAPTPQSPSGTITTGNPTFTWTRPAGATKYALYVYTNATPSVMKLATSTFTATCGASTCSYTPTLNLTVGSYKWQVRAGNTSGWSAYSIWKTFALSAPAAPTPLTPNGPIATSNPTYTWTRPAGVTKYALYVYPNATSSVAKLANYVTPICNASTCSYTPTPTLNLLTTGSYKWAVRAWNTLGWSAYSAWMSFGANSGFNSQFNGSKTNWVTPTGDPTAWNVSSTYLYTLGAALQGASVIYRQSGNEHFGTQTYTAKLMRYGCAGCANALAVRGEPGTLTSDRRWSNVYYFQYTRNGWFMVFKKVNGTEIVIRSWATTSAINQGNAWNILQVRASGSTLKFYINNTLVWTGTDTSFVAGHAGIHMYRDNISSGNILYVDYATLTTIVSSAAQSDVISAEQAALNAAADNRQGSTGTCDMAPTPK
jgi:hypothetical protein